MNFFLLTLFFLATVNTQPTKTTTPSFGKTHFILGAPKQHYQNFAPTKQANLPINNANKTTQVYFSHKDDLEKIICDCIGKENEAISIALYSFTNGNLAQALINFVKNNPKASVSIITDKTYQHDRFSKIPQLAKTPRITVFVYAPTGKQKTLNNIMHHKFAIFEGQKKACNGSLNWTHSGVKSNQENVVFFSDPLIIKEFKKEHSELLKKCTKLS